jgi:predicted short-subunit dehydrogenase-like oxidoreductase (DUF2520 family)
VSERIAIVGPGRMGLALGAALLNSGDIDHITYYGRGLEPPPHPMFDPDPESNDEPEVEYRAGLLPPPSETTAVILAVPDRALAEVSHDLAASGPAPPGCSALHLSGAISADVLAPLHGAGYAIGSLHPLQTVADPWLSGARVTGIAFAIAGEPTAVLAARRIVNALEGIPLVIPPNLRPLYHAAAVMASNYIVAIVAAATRMMQQAGVAESDALPALMPLVEGTVDNLRHLGIHTSLTGPIARGDVDTIRLHLARLSPDELPLYSALGREVLRVARAAGLDAAKAEEIDDLLGPA